MNRTLKEDIFAAAYDIGFILAGVSEPKIFLADEFRKWLDHKNAGKMDFLYRNTEKRLNPAMLVPGTKSILSLAVNYYQPLPAKVSPAKKNIALYAWGRDYHRVVRSMLERLAQKISVLVGRAFKYRAFVDAGPLLEKTLAWQAGLGWIGKNSLLINRQYGSFLFLGELFLDFELPPDTPAADGCGECQSCINACPTSALDKSHVLQADRCISYLTQYQLVSENDLKMKIGTRLFGCDQCQMVCPFNRHAVTTSVNDFLNHHLGPVIDPSEIVQWDSATWAARVSGTVAEKIPLSQWQHNAALILENCKHMGVSGSLQHSS